MLRFDKAIIFSPFLQSNLLVSLSVKTRSFAVISFGFILRPVPLDA